MYKVKTENTDLEQIAKSGQCFRWKKIEDKEDINETVERYAVFSLDKAAVLTADGNELNIDTIPGNEKYFEDYLDLDTDYGAMIKSIDTNDTYLTEAAREGFGIRILRQELWEMMFSYMISQNNNIPRIKNSIEAISEKFGTGHELEYANGRIKWYSIPTPEQLAGKDLTGMGLGYRQPYMEKMAAGISSGDIDIKKFPGLSWETAREELKKITGIGNKVADCVCLFGLHRLEAFPIDTWVKKILSEHYPNGFPTERYPDCSGVMQQYMFYYERKLSLKKL